MKPLITEKDPGYYSAQTEAVEAVGEAIRRDGDLRSDHTVSAYAWAAMGALTETDPDLPEGGWLLVQGRVYRVTEAEQVDDGENRDGVLWAVQTRPERDEEEDEQ